MKLWTRSAMVVMLMCVPLVASAQYRDLDTAVATLERGFSGGGDSQAIAGGIAEGDKVKLQFPGLIAQDGYFGRDQAHYILDGLFSKVKPSGFERLKTSGGSTSGQYSMTARWTIDVAGKPEARELYITLQQKKDSGHWSVASLTSGGK